MSFDIAFSSQQICICRAYSIGKVQCWTCTYSTLDSQILGNTGFERYCKHAASWTPRGWNLSRHNPAICMHTSMPVFATIRLVTFISVWCVLANGMILSYTCIFVYQGNMNHSDRKRIHGCKYAMSLSIISQWPNVNSSQNEYAIYYIKRHVSNVWYLNKRQHTPLVFWQVVVSNLRKTAIL